MAKWMQIDPREFPLPWEKKACFESKLKNSQN